MMAENYTDCRSETGVTVGLLDAIITILRIVAKRDLSPPEVEEALRDLAHDEDLAFLLTAVPTTNKQGITFNPIEGQRDPFASQDTAPTEE